MFQSLEEREALSVARIGGEERWDRFPVPCFLFCCHMSSTCRGVTADLSVKWHKLQLATKVERSRVSGLTLGMPKSQKAIEDALIGELADASRWIQALGHLGPPTGPGWCNESMRRSFHAR